FGFGRSAISAAGDQVRPLSRLVEPHTCPRPRLRIKANSEPSRKRQRLGWITPNEFFGWEIGPGFVPVRQPSTLRSAQPAQFLYDSTEVGERTVPSGSEIGLFLIGPSRPAGMM